MTFRALITGASTGLGAEFARQLAARSIDLVLVARSAGALEELAVTLKERHRIDVEIIPADLTVSDDLEVVATRLQQLHSPIDILISNAGFGVYAGFEASDIVDERRLHELLSWAPLRLAHAALPGMLGRGQGWILNVASAAAFMPSGTYGSAKRGIVSLSQSLNARYRGTGVSVTALCPGLLATEFHERMGEDHLPALPAIVWAPVSRVAREGLRALYARKPVLVSDWRYRLVLPLVALIPARFLERLGTTNNPDLGTH